MNNKFKTYLTIAIVISIIVIIKIALKESIRENALNQIEETYTPTSNSLESSSVSEIPASTSTASTESIPVKVTTNYENSEIETEEITDGNNVSRKETETWILSKLNTYTKETESIFNNSFSFEDGFLVHEFDMYVRPTATNNSTGNMHRRFRIPINDISKIEQEYSLIKISTSNRTIKKYFFEKKREELDNEIVLLFNTDGEPDLTNRLRKAFFHLKTFYKKSNYKEVF